MLMQLTAVYLELLNLRRFKERVETIIEREEKNAGVNSDKRVRSDETE